jgi:phosphoserine phosphatase
MKLNRRISAILITALLLMLTTSCIKENPTISNSLANLNWSDKNLQVINQLITDYGIGGKYYDSKKAPYVVLDWDQTCAHLDCEEALMRFQLTHLRFKISKSQFAGLLKDEINGVTQLSSDFHNIVLKDINADLINDFSFLSDNFSGMNGNMSLMQIQQTPQYQDFIAKIPYLYDGYCSSLSIGADYGYPWVLYLLAGHTIDEVKNLAVEAISFELANNLSKQIWQSPEDFKTNAGAVSYSFKSGLRVLPEMQNLISTFKGHGIDIFIVSASYKPVVEAFSGIKNFGYNVPPENVIAMELEISHDGKILPEYKTGWVKTQRQGKVDAINQAIKVGLGKNWDPIFSASDSDGDYEMSTGFPDMKLTLIWNRVKSGDIGKLSKQAVDEMDTITPRYILQGRNENTGLARPSSESILFGKSTPQLLYN